MGGLKMNVIEIKNLTKSYGKARGIIDVSFNVEQGEILVLLDLMVQVNQQQ